MRKGCDGEKNGKNNWVEKNGENSGPLQSLPVDRPNGDWLQRRLQFCLFGCGSMLPELPTILMSEELQWESLMIKCKWLIPRNFLVFLSVIKMFPYFWPLAVLGLGWLTIKHFHQKTCIPNMSWKWLWMFNSRLLFKFCKSNNHSPSIDIHRNWYQDTI